MSNYQRILVPTDFSPLSVHAAAYARGLAEKHGAEIHVVHVVVPADVAGTLPLAPGAEPVTALPTVDVLLDTARAGVANFARDHFIASPTKADVLVGAAHAQICQYALDHAIDLIVIGSHARGVVHRIFLGSVSKAVLEHSPCPVLMVPLSAVEPQAS